MKHSLNIYLELLKKGREKRRRMVSILLVLSLVVTAVVAWNLRLDSVAATVEAFCGYEEHTHTESCTLEEVLGCDGAEGHVHSVADCFAFENVLSCVSEEHVHGEECYNAEGESICSKSVHTHSDACYTKEAVLVCEIAEGEHVHTEACYEEKWSCGLIEHVHTSECFSNTEADLETAKIWEETLPELSGYWAEDTASIALSQVGYAESDVNFILGDNNEKKHYNRYGQWFGNEYGDWNVMFAEFCLYYAGVTNDYIPMSAGANSWQIKLEKQPYYFTNETKAEGYVPAAGSIIFIDLNADGAADKVAVLTGVSDGFYNTVEGDLNGV
ncbi:MAG: hypothetical protein IKM53_04790, partial [Clostridia bacterium]|nr:hypothetical protein [Clostridia bacterium]